MTNIVNSFFNGIDSIMAWFSSSMKQTTESYCDLESAVDEVTLVAYDGSLISVIEIFGVKELMGNPEFDRVREGLTVALQGNMKNPGHAFQFFFTYDRAPVKEQIQRILNPATNTAKRLQLDLDDLFKERTDYISQYCAQEKTYIVLWTRPALLSQEQYKQAQRDKLRSLREHKIPPLVNGQNFLAAIPSIRDEHSSFVRAIVNDFGNLGIDVRLMEVHNALRAIRFIADPDFTAYDWRPVLPGDKIPVRDLNSVAGDIADIIWPPLGKQILPRDCENLDLRTCRIGDKIYSSVFIDLFPQEVRPFIQLFNRTLPTHIPWRVSFWVESDGLRSIKFRSMIASILSFASSQNRLLSDAAKMLNYINTNSDEAVVKLRVSLSTWAPSDNTSLLRTRTAELAKALQGWGNCEVSETSGDALGGAISSMLAVTVNSFAPASVAPLSNVIYMLPFTRPSSPWHHGAVLLRTPDGKPWPFQPGSSQQTTWIDLFYARPGSGKSVLSNSINLALCLAPGIKALPYISIIDIGPSSSGLISLIKEALPLEKRHQVAYHRLMNTPDYAINPFDTQLGCRFPTPQERAFLVNFLMLLATPVGAERSYEGIADMSGLVVDELYKYFSDDHSPRIYSEGVEDLIDQVLEEIGFVRDEHTTWWEVTDALFVAGFIREALIAQRYAMPLLADAASICRAQAIQDLYGEMVISTGETIIAAFGRMISSSVREYLILSRVTKFELGDARIVSLDLDEVARSGGDAANRQTAVMYMLARYVLARRFFLTDESIANMPSQYQSYHADSIAETKEVPKRIVYDEFHRTSKAEAVREQVIMDMREGRKWNVQIALISQSLSDFDNVMVEFATSIFIMDAGPAQTIKKSAEIFGLSDTAQLALRTRVHGPGEGGATFLAQFATKNGMNLQLLTNTIGPIELWAFSTTAEDASMRNKLYKRLGPKEARRLLARLYPGGSIRQVVEERLARLKESQGFIEEDSNLGIVDQMVEEIIASYKENPDFKRLPMV